MGQTTGRGINGLWTIRLGIFIDNFIKLIKLVCTKWVCFSGGVYQYLIMHIYCPSKPGVRDCGRFWRIFGLVEISALGLLMVPSSCLKKLGMYILPLLQLSAGLVLLMCIASLVSLETCLLSWSMILNCDISALGWLSGELCW